MKYMSKKTKIDGINFASKREAQRYTDLKLLQKSWVIKDLLLQPKFELQPGFKYNGKSIQPITYIADFLYYDNERMIYIVEDTKGYKTDLYMLKKKIFLFTRYLESEYALYFEQDDPYPQEQFLFEETR